ncbi:MAG: LamG domain-containing protein [Candidatus Marinimicrobia bacterium]|nr:LamG domain-containing protein [Candidatus Neomarinimicrobiota bacterium]
MSKICRVAFGLVESVLVAASVAWASLISVMGFGFFSLASWSRLRPLSSLVLVFVVACRFVSVVSADDPSLLLHYTFDRIEAGRVVDHGPQGHDGRVAGQAERLDEVDGRSGVLRLDGDTGRVNVPAVPALHTRGDLTLEMWARRNDPDHKGGTYLRWGNSFVLYGFGEPMVQYRWGKDTIRTRLARHSMFGDDWAHLAVVVEYPRIRLYRNGVLEGDAYMPIQAIEPDSAARIIGAKCPIDLDEVRVYSRALTRKEIEAHARREEIPIPPESEMHVYTDWYEETITLHLSVKGRDAAGHEAELALVDGREDPVAPMQRVPLEESYPDASRYVATAAFPLAGLEGRSLDAVARVFDAGGGKAETVFRHVWLQKPEWVHSPEGRLTEVPPPWTPMEAEKRPDGSVELRVWGRRHTFGAHLFPTQIETRDREILTAPISLTARTDGDAVSWNRAEVELVEASEVAATLEQQADGGSLALHMKTLMEFDGYAIFDCTVTAKRDTTVDRLVLDIPLRSEHATLCFGSNVYEEQQDPRIPMSVLHMGAVNGDLAFRFSPNIWLGDERLGLTWQAESNQDWRYEDAQHALEVLPRGETTHLRANWITVPTRLAEGQTLRYRFALQATPVKPLLREAWDLRILRSGPLAPFSDPALNLPDRWIKRDHEKVDRIYSTIVPELNLTEPGPGRVPALDFYAEMGVRHLFIDSSDNWPWPMPVGPEFARRLKRLINATHAAGLNIYPYLIHERMPTDVPEYDVHGLHMSNTPLKPYEWTVGFCAGSEAAQDAVVHSLAQRLDQFGDDGVYLDGTGVHMKSCQNRLHGCGYRPTEGAISVHGTVALDGIDRGSTDDEAVYPTYPVFADRKMIQRMYIAVKKRRPEGVLDVHSWYWNSGGLAYADVLWTGEQWWQHRGKGVDYVAGELTLDVFRTAFMGYQFGVAAETLPYRLLANNARNSTVAAISLLHDIPVRLRDQDTEWFHIISRLWAFRDAFGAKEAEKLFYWENEDYVTVAPEECYATLLKHPDNGTLAFISNLQRDSAAVRVRFNRETLGLPDAGVVVENVLSGETGPLPADGVMSFDLGSHEWVYVWLRSAP